MTTDIRFTLVNFEGPLHMLLELVESEQLSITAVSLGSVTEQFLAFLEREQRAVPLETLADFLVVAAKLIYLKSKIFLPDLIMEEEETGIPLERQLELFRKYLAASRNVHRLFRKNATAYGRLKLLQQVPFARVSMPENISTGSLYQSMLKVVERLSQLTTKRETHAVARVLSIRDTMQRMRDTITLGARSRFREILANAGDRTEMIVTFLALLELVKQRFLVLEQDGLFEDFRITRIET